MMPSKPQQQGTATINAIPREMANRILLDAAASLGRMRADAINLYSQIAAMSGAAVSSRDQLRRASMGAIGSMPVDMDALAGDGEILRMQMAMTIVAEVIMLLQESDSAEAFMASLPEPSPTEAA